MLTLRDRTWLVTGASAGLGRAIATALVRDHGARVILTARRADRLEALAHELGPAADAVAADLSTPAGLDTLWSNISNRDLDGAVFSAGAHAFGPFSAMDEAAIDALMHLDVTAPVKLARRLLPRLEQKGHGGLLFIGSTGGFMPTPNQALYGGAKSLLLNFVRSLHFERGGADDKLHVTIACPGGMPTDMLADSLGTLLSRRPLIRRMLMPTERAARLALEAWLAHRPEAILGRRNQAMVAYATMLPLSVLGRGTAKVYDPSR